VFIWFIALSITGVALVFDSPNLDYRLVAFGSVLPAVEIFLGGPWIGHTLLLPVSTMFLIMLVARGKRLTQRKWLGLPIGLFAHLVLDASWAKTEVFWWPAMGLDSLGGSRVPEMERWPAVLLLELIGIIVGCWIWRRFRLNDEGNRRTFIREGKLNELRK
tara:strand:- start:267 stop:749 length:483 start_codon:yes stop_codon:yes gene_type:complete